MPETTIERFTIPTIAELDAIAAELATASDPVDRIASSLFHATGGAEEPREELATTPTLEQIGALCVFLIDVRSNARMLKVHADSIERMLENLDSRRRSL